MTPFPNIELNLFERLVQQTAAFLTVFHDYSFIFVSLYGLQVLIVWLLFNYHRHILNDHDFFMTNIDIAGRFTVKTYDMFMWLCTAFAPCGFCLICYSLLTRFSTRKFVKTFGTKRLKTNL